MILLGLLWGVTFPVARVCIDAGANPFLLVAVELLLAAGVMAPVAYLTHTGWPRARRLVQSAGLGALLIAGINLPLNWGLQFATGGEASIVYATSPIISLVVLWGLGSAIHVYRRQLLALGTGLAGVLLLGLASVGGSRIDGLMAMAAFGIGAVCQGTGAVLIGRSRPQGEDHWGLTFQFLGGAIAAFLVLPLVAPSPAFPLTGAVLGPVVYLGVVSMVVGYTIFFGLIREYGAVRANQVTFLNPVVALFVGVVAFGEGFEPLEAAALALIVLALVLLQPSERRTLPDSRAPTAGRPDQGEAS